MEKMSFGLEEMHRIQLQMLKRTDEICKNHGLMYYLAFGSLLGAIRNHKVIEWDDSIDVVVPYKDYHILEELPPSEWGEDLFFQTCDTDPEYPRYYAKLRNSATTLIKSEYMDKDINQGIYINIIPLIHLADSPAERQAQFRDIGLFRALTERKPLSGGGVYLKLHSGMLLRFANERKISSERERVKERILRYEEKDTADCAALAGVLSSTLPLKRAWFRTAEKWKFEDLTVNIPCGWHEWLSLRYGDYRAVPISELQEEKIAGFITLNTKEPFGIYKGKTYCVK